MQVGDVVISGAVHLHGVGSTIIVVEEVMGFGFPVGSDLLLQQLAAGVEVGVGYSRFRRHDPLVAVGCRLFGGLHRFLRLFDRVMLNRRVRRLRRQAADAFRLAAACTSPAGSALVLDPVVSRGLHIDRLFHRAADRAGAKGINRLRAAGECVSRAAVAVIARSSHNVGLPLRTAGAGFQRIAVRAAGRCHRFGNRVDVGMVCLHHRRFLRPDAVQVVAVGHGGFRVALGIGRAGQSSAAGPGEGPIPAIIVSRGIAAAVVGDGVAVIRRQQVLPAFVAVGIAVGFGAVGGSQQVTRGIVGKLAGQPVGPAEADGIPGNAGGGASCPGGVGVRSARFAVDARQAAQSVVEVLDFPAVTLESVLSEACRFLPQQPDLMLMFSESQSHHDASRT